MAVATLSSKNQIVIPREAREALDLKPGDKLVIRAHAGKILILEKPKSYRESDEENAAKYYALLSTYPNLEWVSPTLEIADLAAEIRALHRLRTPDALQAATAVHSNVTTFLTNDPVFRRIKNFEALILD